MKLTRRFLLAAAPTTLFLPKAFAAGGMLAPRLMGNPDAKVKVHEWFSLTCYHCARFQKETFPRVKAELIDTGRIAYYFHEFPLDQVALLGSMLALSLPNDRYIPFCEALLSSLDRWAFARDVDPVKQLRQMAALAGISGTEFDRINADNKLRQMIIDTQDRDQKRYHIEGTPYFRFNTIEYKAELRSYDDFLKEVKKAEA
ncbi:Thiol:disulfide interchange protein [Acetobacteraceae bacterium EV16G]|uniref:Thiol:disulfide interchange protein n=1 Tax=Sorlinia euscelidii TaxID=3081148 RepID=A0ABU7U699_9PROT